MYSGFTSHSLDQDHIFYTGYLPQPLQFSQATFTDLWALHPNHFNSIQIHGKDVFLPRWQQAYGADYYFSRQTSKALPIPALFQKLLTWIHQILHKDYNGLLVNWYDGKLAHYIGKHRDSIANLIYNLPIIIISFGESRCFRLRPYQGKGYIDFLAENNSIFLLPFDTNLAWTHEIPYAKKYQGQRVSITIRAFNI